MKVALLHRHTPDRIKETNAAYPYLANKVDTLTFKSFNRLGQHRKFWKSLAWVFYAPTLVLGRGYDVIYCDDSYPFYPILVKLVSPKSRVVIRLGDFHLMYNYSGFLYTLLHAIEKIGWRMADEVIAISEVMRDKIEDEVCRPVEVVLDPVDTKQFHPQPFLKPDQKIVMFHGMLTRNKNVDVLIEAAKRLPEFKFWIVGDGPDAKRLKAMAPKNVVFKGWQSQDMVAFYISMCDVGVALRSDNPGNQYVLTSPFLQYGAMGKPCLVTKRKVFGDYPWQIEDSYEMDKQIKYLMGHPEEGYKLRQHILEFHDAEKIAREIWDILTQVS